MKELTVDRIEGQIIVVECEDSMFELPLSLFPDCQEGDILSISKQSADTKEKKSQEAQARLERLEKKSPPSSNIIDL